MATLKNKIIPLLLSSILLLDGCGKKEAIPAPATPLEAVECTMECIKTLDMETLNNCTDNYVETYHNWIGIPTENEYRVFNELLQPRSKRSNRYQSAYKLDQKMTEKLTWEITDVRENSDTAEIDMIITNIDMSQVMETYTNQILENMLEGPGIGISQLINDMTELSETKGALISIIDHLDDSDVSVISVTVSAYLDEGQWKIHLTHDFINAFSGNMYADDYTADVEPNISELEERLDDSIEQWSEKIERQMTKWAEQFERYFSRGGEI